MEGAKVQNNLYKLQVRIYPPQAESDEPTYPMMLQVTEKLPTWEMWHRHYGHISYAGLKFLYANDLVNRFKVNKGSLMPDCEACIEAKQTESSHNKTMNRCTKPRELTHIDLWGKYEVTSINRHQHYIVLVNDTMRYITVDFLKGKYEATQQIIIYLMYLIVNPKSLKKFTPPPHAIFNRYDPPCREEAQTPQSMHRESCFVLGCREQLCENYRLQNDTRSRDNTVKEFCR